MSYKSKEQRNKAALKYYYENRKEIYKKQLERRQRYKLEVIKYKGGKCQLCGYNNNPAALVFHHRDPSDKEMSISSMVRKYGLKKIFKEADKCDLLCANCHAEVEYPKCTKEK